jgi:GH25 family lysozyme M1 (1,4-beta-N-acetylmuramidase)
VRWLAAIVIALGTVAVPAGAGPVEAVPAGVPGVDVSSYQGSVNWAVAVAAGARFAILKATEGLSYVDAYFYPNYPAAERAGLYVGAYHYGRPDISGGKPQADYLLAHAGYEPDGRTLPPMLDIEWPWSGSGARYPCYGLSPAQMVGWIHDFVDEIKARTGRAAMIYTNTNWWKPCTGNDPGFGANPLIISGYTASPPPLPAGWTRYTMWQYADSGPLPGDQDVFNGSLQDLDSFAGGDGSS